VTVSTTQSSSVMLGNGVTTSFSFSFNNAVPSGQSASQASYTVIYTSPTGVETTLASSAYTLAFNAAAAGSLWGNGGTLTYPTVGSPIANGSTLTLIRTFPLTQTTTISNQGDFSPQVIEEMGDTLEMQIQQLNNRTTQWRGTWMSGVVYNPGDIVQDGANGAATNNYYICLIGNTSGVWLTDLGAGDWTLSVQATVPTALTALTGDVTGTGTGTIATTIGANKVTNAKLAQTPGLTILGNNTAGTANVSSLTIAQVNTALGSFVSVNVQKFAASATYTPSAGMVWCSIEVWGGGGGGGGGETTTSGSCGGGGAGGYDKLVASAATIGASQSVTIGAGGLAGSNTGGTGGTGGTTSVGALVQATGGTGGIGNTGSAGVAGGAGGVGSGGSYSATGQPGGPGPYANAVAVWFTGAGGATSLGGNGASQIYTSGNISIAGANAVANSGSGGSGAGFYGSSTQRAGGVGGSGYVVITEYIS
jgi:hypothetical protein